MNRELIVNLHSIIGVLVFVTGLLQIVMKKGGYWHRLLGNIYLYSWLVLLVSGAYIGGLIITIIGIFGFYFTITGARIGRLKNTPMGIFEQIIFVLGLLLALAMLYYSGKLYFMGDSSFAIIYAVFGILFLLTTVSDILKYIKNKPLKANIYGNKDWYFEHLRRMGISFIAAVTAFTSIQNVFQNNTLNFLMPTVIGVVIINLAKKHYQKKFSL